MAAPCLLNFKRFIRGNITVLVLRKVVKHCSLNCPRSCPAGFLVANWGGWPLCALYGVKSGLANRQFAAAAAADSTKPASQGATNGCELAEAPEDGNGIVWRTNLGQIRAAIAGNYSALVHTVCGQIHFQLPVSLLERREHIAPKRNRKLFVAANFSSSPLARRPAEHVALAGRSPNFSQID